MYHNILSLGTFIRYIIYGISFFVPFFSIQQVNDANFYLDSISLVTFINLFIIERTYSLRGIQRLLIHFA